VLPLSTLCADTPGCAPARWFRSARHTLTWSCSNSVSRCSRSCHSCRVFSTVSLCGRTQPQRRSAHDGVVVRSAHDGVACCGAAAAQQLCAPRAPAWPPFQAPAPSAATPAARRLLAPPLLQQPSADCCCSKSCSSAFVKHGGEAHKARNECFRHSSVSSQSTTRRDGHRAVRFGRSIRNGNSSVPVAGGCVSGTHGPVVTASRGRQ
jgi:hypothetical protein